MKRFASALLAALLTLSLAACGSKGTDSSSSQQDSSDLKEITFCLDWTPNTNHTGLYVAQKLGYYQEAGLDVEIVQAPEDGAPSLVASGKAQFGINAQDTMAPAFIGDAALPVTAVAALVQHNTSGILSLAGKGITSPKGLEGHIYATWENPVEQAMMKYCVEKDGGDFSKVNLVPSTPTDIITSLQTNVDSIWVFYGWDGIAAEVQGIDMDYWAFSDIEPTFDYYTPVILANNAFLESDPETAKAFLAATAKGYEYCIEHPKEAADILLEASPELDADLVYASQEYLSTQYKADVDRWGYIDPARWDGFYQWLWDNQLVEEELPAGTGYTNDYLPQ